MPKLNKLPKEVFQNFDCMNLEELVNHAELLSTIVLPPTNEEGETVQRVILDYLSFKIAAMIDRFNGYVAQALESEKHCDRLYQTLPNYAKW